jgi:hypothetical protein
MRAQKRDDDKNARGDQDGERNEIENDGEQRRKAKEDVEQ